MIIGVAGPYPADTEEQRQRNLDAMNKAAAVLLEKGHVPLIGVNAALPVVAHNITVDKYKAIMDISMAVIDKCEAILILAESPGANRERDHVAAKGLPVYYSLEEVPAAYSNAKFEKETVFIRNLLSNTPGLDKETVNAVEHYLDHAEFEMAFEGLFLDIIKSGLKPDMDYNYCHKIAAGLNLNKESVLDAEFWTKFEQYIATNR